jgi:hypothetical protein
LLAVFAFFAFRGCSGPFVGGWALGLRIRRDCGSRGLWLL